jgi:hypothetical protein
MEIPGGLNVGPHQWTPQWEGDDNEEHAQMIRVFYIPWFKLCLRKTCEQIPSISSCILVRDTTLVGILHKQVAQTAEPIREGDPAEIHFQSQSLSSIIGVD